MMNEIINAVARTIDAVFSESYRVYTERIEQGMEGPCFFILPLSPAYNRYRGQRYYSENSILIQFIPEGRNRNKDCGDIAVRLFHCLELIELDDCFVRGMDMAYEIVEGVLQFTIHYNLFLYNKNDNEAMETYTQKTEAR